MVKVSKAGKARLKRCNMAERKAVQKASMLLADMELLSDKRYDAIMRALKSCSSGLR